MRIAAGGDVARTRRLPPALRTAHGVCRLQRNLRHLQQRQLDDGQRRVASARDRAGIKHQRLALPGAGKGVRVAVADQVPVAGVDRAVQEFHVMAVQQRHPPAFYLQRAELVVKRMSRPADRLVGVTDVIGRNQ